MSVYYFSGTGNSLAVARRLSEALHEKLICIPAVMSQGRIAGEGDLIGIVYPVYNHIVPFIIKRFVERLDLPKGKYVFAACTYGDNPCASLELLDKIIKKQGSFLSAGFALKMPYNYISPASRFRSVFRPFVLKENTPDQTAGLLEDCENKMVEIINTVGKRDKAEIDIRCKELEHLIDFLNLRNTLQKNVWLKIAGYKEKTKLPYIECVTLMDHGFFVDEKCAGCGTCERICPVGNIRIIHGRRRNGCIAASNALPAFSGAQSRRFSLGRGQKTARDITIPMLRRKK